MKDAVIERLFEFMENKRVRDSELAEILGITRSNPGQWKKGVSAPTLKNFIAILDYFPDLNVEWLFRGATSGKLQKIKGNYNTQVGRDNVSKEPSFIEAENKHLKQIITEKEKQIELLKELLKK